MQDIVPYGDNFAFVIPVDFKLHTIDHPFCPVDPSCPCHEDHTLLAEVAMFVAQGLLTEQEATDFVVGKMI